jgi:hypothetical protein
MKIMYTLNGELCLIIIMVQNVNFLHVLVHVNKGIFPELMSTKHQVKY